MDRENKNSAFSLQLFGEDASGEIGVDAALPMGVTGEDAPSHGESDGNREQEFEDLISGKYKDVYEQRVSHIVQKRVKQSKQTNAFLQALSREYGVDSNDLSALQQAVLGNQPSPHTHNPAVGVYDELSKQARDLLQVYPSFNLQEELKNEKFQALLRIPSVDMQTAFELTHKEEILPAVIEAATRNVEKRLAQSMAAGSLRPNENGTASQSPSLVRNDVATFTKGQMEEICKRVSRGEKIYL